MIDALGPAQRMLDFVVAYFDTNGWDLPPRRYLTAGSPMVAAADDAHLLVGLDRMLPGASDATSRGGAALSRAAGSVIVPRADYVIRLMRCIAGVTDDGDIPSAPVLNADGQRLLRDPGRLLTAVMWWRETELEALNPNPNVTIGQVDVLGPMGGLAGHAVRVTIGPVQ